MLKQADKGPMRLMLLEARREKSLLDILIDTCYEDDSMTIEEMAKQLGVSRQTLQGSWMPRRNIGVADVRLGIIERRKQREKAEHEAAI